jgi:cell division protein FtsQ|tara:strand:+ start:1889 stop:2575 length:687 start_codon:yes stop_codon:yes gene_type:complete
MPQLIDKRKKLFLYIIFLFLLTTFNNISLINFKLLESKINQINVSGLSKDNNLEISKDLSKLIFENIFFLNKNLIIDTLKKNNLIDSFTVKKIYPGSLDLKIKKTKFLAIVNFKEENFFIGSNGKLIKYDQSNKTLPYFFGKINLEDFKNFVKIIEKSKFEFNEISEIFYFQSGRWDIKNKDGVLFKLPKKNLLKNLNFANKIANNEKLINAKIIDLRVLNRMITKND